MQEDAIWFNIEHIPDEFLPVTVFQSEGGATRRKSSVMDLFLEQASTTESVAVVVAKTQPLEGVLRLSTQQMMKDEAWRKVAETIYDTRSSNFKSNIIHVRRIFAKNEEMITPLLKRYPNFIVILCYILEDKFGLRVRKVDWTLEMKNWSDVECRHVGCR